MRSEKIRDVRISIDTAISQIREDSQKEINANSHIENELHILSGNMLEISAKIYNTIKNNATNLDACYAEFSFLKGVDYQVWVSKFDKKINIRNNIISKINIREINESLAEKESKLKSLITEYNFLCEEIVEIKTSFYHKNIYKWAKAVTERYNDTRYEDLNESGKLKCFFSNQADQAVKLRLWREQFLLSIDDDELRKKLFDMTPEKLTSHDNCVKKKLKEAEDKKCIISNDRENTSCKLTDLLRIKEEYDEARKFIDDYNNDRTKIDFMLDSFENYSLNSDDVASFAGKYEDIEINNKYQELMAKVKVLDKIKSSLTKSKNQMYDIESKLNKNLSKIRSVSSGNSVKFDISGFNNKMKSLHKTSRSRTGWYENNSNSIINYHVGGSNDYLTWLVIYQAMLCDIAFADHVDQSGALMIFGDDMTIINNEMDNVSLESLDLTELSGIENFNIGTMSDIDTGSYIESSIREISSSMDTISSSIDKVSDSLSSSIDSSTSSSTSSTSSFSSDSCGGGGGCD
jgi:hypothetical protein